MTSSCTPDSLQTTITWHSPKWSQTRQTFLYRRSLQCQCFVYALFFPSSLLTLPLLRTLHNMKCNSKRLKIVKTCNCWQTSVVRGIKPFGTSRYGKNDQHCGGTSDSASSQHAVVDGFPQAARHEGFYSSRIRYTDPHKEKAAVTPAVKPWQPAESWGEEGLLGMNDLATTLTWGKNNHTWLRVRCTLPGDCWVIYLSFCVNCDLNFSWKLHVAYFISLCGSINDMVHSLRW